MRVADGLQGLDLWQAFQIKRGRSGQLLELFLEGASPGLARLHGDLGDQGNHRAQHVVDNDQAKGYFEDLQE